MKENLFIKYVFFLANLTQPAGATSSALSITDLPSTSAGSGIDPYSNLSITDLPSTSAGPGIDPYSDLSITDLPSTSASPDIGSYSDLQKLPPTKPTHIQKTVRKRLFAASSHTPIKRKKRSLKRK